MKKRYLLSILVAAVCLFLASRGVRWNEIAQAFRNADYRVVPLVLGINLVGVLIRTIRWRTILGPIKRVGFINVMSAMSIGFMGNFLFPARAGEIIRAYVIGRREGVSKSASFATIVVERLFDGFAILLFLALTPLMLSLPDGNGDVKRGVTLAACASLALYLVVLAVLVVFRRHPERFAAWTGRLLGLLPERLATPLQRLVMSFGGGLEILGNVRHLAAVAAWSLLLWSVIAVGNWLMLRAFSLPLPLFAGFFLVVIQSFGVMVPTPGYLGSFQYAHVLGLSLFGVGEAQALSLGILLHGIIFVFYVGMGLVFLPVEGMRLTDVRAQEDAHGDGCDA